MRARTTLYIVVVAVVVSITVITGCSNRSDAEKERTNITIVHPILVDALREVENGAREILTTEEFNVSSFSAEGDETKFLSTVESALVKRPAVMIAVGTQMSLTVLNNRFNASMPPVVSTAITNPVDVLKKEIDPPRSREIVVLSDTPKGVEKGTIDMIRAFRPHLAKIGLFYNPQELNSNSSAKNLIQYAEGHSLEVVAATITRFEDLQNVVESLIVRGAEAIVIVKDKIGTGNGSIVVQACLRAPGKQKPLVFAMDEGTVREHHVIGAVSTSYREIGRATGMLVKRILSGEKASEMLVTGPEKATLYLGAKGLELFELDVPEQLRGKAVLIPKSEE